MSEALIIQTTNALIRKTLSNKSAGPWENVIEKHNLHKAFIRNKSLIASPLIQGMALYHQPTY